MRKRGLRLGRRTAFALLCGMLATGIAAPARGHTRSISYSVWELDASGATVRARISRLDVTRLDLDPIGSTEDSETLAQYLATRIELRVGSRPCVAQRPPVPLRAPSGWLVYAWRLECPDAGIDFSVEPHSLPRSIGARILLEVAPSHLHFIRLERPDGSVLDRVISKAEPLWEIPAARSTAPRNATDADSGPATIARYLRIGAQHILSGWDHLAFVLALLLLARTLAQVAGLVSAFTVAHSLTLALATLDVIRPEAAAVETLIGFSIALVAAENAWLLGGRRRSIPAVLVVALVASALAGGGAVTRIALLGLALFSACHFGLLRRSSQPARLRAAVAFAFGLIHGFGFAGVLFELSLPTDRLLPALFGFNLGVELGQLGVVALAWPLLRALKGARDGRIGRIVMEAGSAAICGLGIFWFVTRNFG